MLLRAFLALLFALPAFAQSGSATLEVALRDMQRASLPGCVEASNASRDFRLSQCVRAGQAATMKGLPAGKYRLVVTSQGFASRSLSINLQLAERKTLTVDLAVAPLNTEVNVTADTTLLDPTGGATQRLSARSIEQLPAATPGRTIVQAVQSQPGWIVEANGVLHPRGSEYDTMYIVDGLPITSNRSPGFAPATTLNDIESLETTTSGYSAEYGRHLGGVVEVATNIPHIDGLHGQLEMNLGSFHTAEGSASVGYGGKHTSTFLGLDGFTTDRYLDPPTLQNFTNNGAGRNLSARLDHDFDSKQTLRLWFTNSATGLEVPNEVLQQVAGQRQNRHLDESAGYVIYDRVLSSSSLFSAKFMSRDGSATLESNPNSTPIRPTQDRGLRENYLSLDFAAQTRRHEFKAGGQFSRTGLHEQFGLTITDPSFFDPTVPAQFSFNGHATGHTEAFFVEDRYRIGAWTLSAGARWDHYSLLVRDHGFSPRLALAYHIAPLGMVFHASYDRAFEEPPLENLLLASSTSALRLGSTAAQLPIPMSRGDFGDAGLSKLFLSKLRIDANVFLRNSRNFLDDDLLLNTGVNLPISFARASIYGAELKLELPHWSRISGFASYSYLLGRSVTPVTGGLFLASDATDLFRPGQIFPITQDQRNTAFATLRGELTHSVWAAASFSYGSGLPTEIDPGISREVLVAQFGASIVDQVDLARNRVRPNHSLDFSVGWQFWHRERRSAQVKLDLTNVTDKLNVVDFAGLFSGTALAKPRAADVRLGYQF